MARVAIMITQRTAVLAEQGTAGKRATGWTLMHWRPPGSYVGACGPSRPGV